jgi:hypothetical protein
VAAKFFVKTAQGIAAEILFAVILSVAEGRQKDWSVKPGAARYLNTSEVPD